MRKWLSEHPGIVALLIFVGGAVSIAAMMTGTDLSQVYELLQDLLGR